MHRDRNNETWSELKAKRHHKFDDAPLDSLDVMQSQLDGETNDVQKVKYDRAAKLATHMQDMADYADKRD